MLEFGKGNLIEEIGTVCDNLQISRNAILAENKPGLGDCVQFGMLVVAVATFIAGVCANKKTLKQVQHQIDCQQQQWNDEFYLRYKQQKFIEYRTRFISLCDIVYTFHRIMGPGILGYDFFNPNQEAKFVYSPIVIPISQTPGLFIAEGLKVTHEFLEFMKNEELFINETKWLHRDLTAFANSFFAFLTSVNQAGLINKSFKQINGNWQSCIDKEMRYLYLRYWPHIIRNDVGTSMLQATPNKNMLTDVPGDNYDRFRLLADNDAEFHYYTCIVNEWLEMWRGEIDAVLAPSGKRIKLSDACCDTEKTPKSITVPQYFNIIHGPKD